MKVVYGKKKKIYMAKTRNKDKQFLIGVVVVVVVDNGVLDSGVQ